MTKTFAILSLLLAAAAARAEDKSYALEQAVPAEVAVGKAATATLAIVPRTPYHTNKEYPTRLRASAPADVALPRPEQRIPDAKQWTDARGEFEVPFTVGKAGTYEIALDLKSAVCTKETCVPFKEKLVWKVVAK